MLWEVVSFATGWRCCDARTQTLMQLSAQMRDEMRVVYLLAVFSGFPGHRFAKTRHAWPTSHMVLASRVLPR